MAKAAFQVPPIPFMETSPVPSSQSPVWPASMPQMHRHGLGPQDPLPSLPGQGFKLLSKMRGSMQGTTIRTGPQPWPPNPLWTGHQAQHPGVAQPASQEQGFQLVPISAQHPQHKPSGSQPLLSLRSVVLSKQTHSFLLLQAPASFPPPPWNPRASLAPPPKGSPAGTLHYGGSRPPHSPLTWL